MYPNAELRDPSSTTQQYSRDLLEWDDGPQESMARTSVDTQPREYWSLFSATGSSDRPDLGDAPVSNHTADRLRLEALACGAHRLPAYGERAEDSCAGLVSDWDSLKDLDLGNKDQMGGGGNPTTSISAVGSESDDTFLTSSLRWGSRPLRRSSDGKRVV